MTGTKGPKAKLQQARTKEERATIIEGLRHDVGFAKPPKATQFRPGKSGNPRGRQRGVENLRTVLSEEVGALIEVNEAGKRRKFSKQRVALRQLINKAASGELKAFALLIDLLRKSGQLNPPEAVDTPVLDARDLKTFTRFAEFLGSGPDETEGDSPAEEEQDVPA